MILKVGTYKCVKSLSPLKAYLDAVSILLLSMNLWKIKKKKQVEFSHMLAVP